MTQLVISNHFPYLVVSVLIRGVTFQTETLIDTGFDGALILPESFIDSIPGQPLGEGVWRLGDGSEVWAPHYEGEIQVGAIHAPISDIVTFLSTEAILGRLITDNFRITLDHGRQVLVEP